VVTFNDSLEHFADPWAVLRLVQQHLAPGGSVIMSVPNVRYVDNVYHLVFEMDWRYRERGILDSTHLRFFTKKSLVRTLESEHFVVEKITGIRGKYWIGRAARPFVRLFGEWLEDMNYMQYAVVASMKLDGEPKGSGNGPAGQPGQAASG